MAARSHLPLKLNMSGVIPPIFASSIILFPATVGNWFGQADSISRWLQRIRRALMSPGQPIYVLFYGLLIVFFCFFYTALVFNSQGDGGEPEEVRRLHSRHPPGRADRRIYRQRC